ncbi:MAG TPA: VOC family protein [Steroidobacteraceae bacterium]|jgi:predicted 3-demethylubiquinone-9 3-methyltransferase (glyoxalase superfamily)|nr:VOC family protein [Steroidobacteraceae bacterium]
MQLTPFLMFAGNAQSALRSYVALFPDSRILSLELYAAGERGSEGSVKRAVFELNGARYMCIDSPVQHDFTFTPSISLFVECDSLPQFEQLLAALSIEGKVLMPAGAYGFSQRFAWIQDRFGVSWQFNLP